MEPFFYLIFCNQFLHKILCYYTKKITKLKKSEKGIKTYLVSKDKINKLIFQKKFCNASHIASFLKVIKVPTK